MASIIVKRIDPQSLNLKEQVVSINRVTKVVKGGKNLSFSALVVVGDSSAKVVGFGVGKAKEVPSAIRKGIEAAKKNLRKIHLLETTIPHQVLGRFGSGHGAAEAGAGRHRRDRRRPGARRDAGRGDSERADQIDRLAQSAQRGEGDHQRARAVARQERGGGDARPGRGEDVIMMEGKIKIKLVRSPICTPEKHKRIVRGLGLRKINQVVERPDTPGFRGMVKKIPHLLVVVEE